MPISIPAITWPPAADADATWDAFWELTEYINGNIVFSEDIDFGTAHDFSTTSKNIKPHKIRWDIAGESGVISGPGHDHGGSTQSGPISASGLKKMHFDPNSCQVLWTDIWGDESSPHKYGIISGCAFFHGAGNPTNIELPTAADDDSDSSGNGYATDLSDYVQGSGNEPSALNAYDTKYDDWEMHILGYLCTMEAVSANPTVNWQDGTSVVVKMAYDYPSTKHKVYLSNTTSWQGTTVHFLMFVRWSPGGTGGG